MLTKNLEGLVEGINEKLQTLIPSSGLLNNSLYDGARYTLSAPGKRIRPLLVLTAAEMLGCDKEKAIYPACAIEMVHTYSMIHDDLPCMDDDDFRRGRPTLHRVMSEGEALLVGNYLFTEAFLVIGKDSTLSPDQKVKLMKALAEASGGNGMIGGQMMDLKTSNTICDLSLLKTIHKLKTGALIRVCLEFGGILANANDATYSQLIQFGEKFGLLFQLVDDLLDFTASEEKHGKKTSSDEKNNKATYVTLLGLEKSQNIANEIAQEVYEDLKVFPYDTCLLKCIVDKVSTRIYNSSSRSERG